MSTITLHVTIDQACSIRTGLSGYAAYWSRVQADTQNGDEVAQILGALANDLHKGISKVIQAADENKDKRQNRAPYGGPDCAIGGQT